VLSRVCYFYLRGHYIHFCRTTRDTSTDWVTVVIRLLPEPVYCSNSPQVCRCSATRPDTTATCRVVASERAHLRVVLIIASASSWAFGTAAPSVRPAGQSASPRLPTRRVAGDVAAERISQHTTSTAALSVEPQQPATRWPTAPRHMRAVAYVSRHTNLTDTDSVAKFLQLWSRSSCSLYRPTLTSDSGLMLLALSPTVSSTVDVDIQ